MSDAEVKLAGPLLLAAPTLETERLRLRAHTLEDFDTCAAMWGDPAVTRFIGGKPRTREEAWSGLLRYAGHWSLLGYGYWAIEERESGRFIGEVGIVDFKREIAPSFGGAPEMGWMIGPEAQGKRYASEAGEAVVAWADAHFDAARLVCIIDPRNKASFRIAEKLGFTPFSFTTYKGAPITLHERKPAAS